jgi:hypothetical protein
MKNLLLLLCLATAIARAQTPTYLQWAFSIDDTCNLLSTTVDASGNVINTGFFQGAADFDPGPGVYSLGSTSFYKTAFISKVDAMGNFAWAVKLDGTTHNYCTSVVTDAAGNVYAAGYFGTTVDFDPGPSVYTMTPASINHRIFVIKLSSAGNFVWARNLGGNPRAIDSKCHLAIDQSSNLYVSDSFTGTADFDPGAASFNLTSNGSSDVFVTKLDASGNFLWAKNIGGPGVEDCSAIETDAQNNLYMAGQFEGMVDMDPGTASTSLSSLGNSDAFILKLDASGNFAWAKKIGDIGKDYPVSMDIDAAGNICTTGYFENIVDFNPAFAIANLDASTGKYFILKLDQSGNYMWAVNIAGEISAVAVSPAGQVFAAGSFAGTVDFDPGTGSANLTYAGSSYYHDAFMLMLTSSGSFISVGHIVNGSGNVIAADARGNVYMGGPYSGSSDFDTSGGIYNMTTASIVGSVFMLKANMAPVGIEEKNNSASSITIGPNPTSGMFRVHYTKADDVGINVFNSLGELIVTAVVENEVSTIDLSQQPDGVYFVTLKSNGNVISTSKLIKQ